MRLKWKGIYKGEEQLPKVDLPENAVMYREPKSMAGVNGMALLMCIPAILPALAIIALSAVVKGHLDYDGNIWMMYLALLLCFVAVLPHELLHAICFGKEAEVELYFSPKHMAAFVCSTVPMTKGQFIFLSMLPNLVLGWIPLLVWAFVPMAGSVGTVLLMFSMACILVGGGDYINVWNTLHQVPKGATVQNSGFHSYWYVKE
ncbi:MAG: DUF3267 domain-containing protein [Ruminococcus sp.]|nr:DUF3267 domain-containing protein [Ruminococcus sp.]